MNSKSAQEFIIQHFPSVLEASAEGSKMDVQSPSNRRVSETKILDNYRYLDSLSNEAKQLVISLVEKGEPNLYHSFMSVLNQKKDITKEDVHNFYYVKNSHRRPYLDKNRNLVDEVFELCWNQVHN